MKLCVALDTASFNTNLALVKELKGLDVWFKIGLRSYLRDGVKLIDAIHQTDDFKIFLDLKIHDIPNTLADACEVVANLEVDMINLHASAGLAAMSEVMNRLNSRPHRPLVLAVTALTSFSEDEFKNIYNQDIKSAVIKMSQTANQAGIDGVVCSVFESLPIKYATSKEFLTLTPGIRPFGEAFDDQKRVADLSTAKANLSDFIVVGRPIYKAQNPREVCERILSEI
ncbi:orotidine-5'-phosphate decarboxylase [Campylobacter geochelonis]|uniref:Orotidine 5'-phosphate decarboxylase n=1 Tax=Campylobacter geochelonis TaxID=1780362 RepID=A0A128EFU9_9BACT|nr:orotidine-5'-phosphate decarboxylase [Campylobacter geochelonis]QKF71822.1 orotidine-5'-phosphate decarboxylase [Campylobacter geochelonis]CZE47457.1 orotidine 5'-phosphate decarboxylase [Campylobacter geochelonis]